MKNALTVLSLTALIACGGSGDDTDSGTTSTPTGSTATGTATGTTGTGTATGSTTSVDVPATTGDPATVPLNGECDLANKYGTFQVTMHDTFTIADGDAANGVVPITILEEVGTEGSCVLKRRNNPFCDPSCAPNETCDFDGTCIPYPENQDIGYVTIGGLVEDIVIWPLAPGNNYFDTNMVHPSWNPGDLIELRTEGGFFESVEMHGVGVEPITLGEPDWTLIENEDFVFTWSPPTTSVVRSEVHVRLNIDQHGNTPVQMFCIFEDTGTATLPAALVTELMNFGVTGFPNATVTRRTMDSTPVGDGCMEFMVSSPTDPSILVDGFVPCFTDADCPPGETCNTAIQICE